MWERSQRIKCGHSWTLWVDRAGKRPRWIATADRDGISQEPAGRGFNRRREALEKVAAGIGERIVQYRIDHELTQEDLARRLGVRAITISRWERGEQIPTKAVMAELHKMLTAN